MESKDLRSAYRSIVPDSFPEGLEISFRDAEGRQTLFYERVEWTIGGERRGLRYGENPGQPAALYRLVNGGLVLGQVRSIAPGRYLLSDVELLQSGKHPGKTNITDIDSAVIILKELTDRPTAVIVKHNTPCGVARADSVSDAYSRAYDADRLAAFGGAVALSHPVDKATAEAVAATYCEVLAAPDFEEGALGILAASKNLRVMRIANLARLQDFSSERFVDFRSLNDGGIIAQWSFQSTIRSPEDFILPEARHDGQHRQILRRPTPAELDAMIFGWRIQAGVTSNSVIFVTSDATVGIGTGEQDRVGSAVIARDKAYRKMEDRLAWRAHGRPFHDLSDDAAREILAEVQNAHGGLPETVMVSDGFFPFRDGVDVGLREGVRAVLQPGGSLRDWEVIDACNEYNATMMFTGERVFRH